MPQVYYKSVFESPNLFNQYLPFTFIHAPLWLCEKVSGQTTNYPIFVC